jgi:TonB family protein
MTSLAPRLALTLLILGGAPALAAAAPPAATPPAAPQPAAAGPAPQPPDPDAVFYPAAARAAGVEGRAVIHCARTNHLQLKDCALVSETPAGQGFGAAALAMAAANQPNPLVDTAEPALVAPADITVSFRLRPPGIDPDLSVAAHVVTRPAILAVPTFEQVKSAYPVRALSDSVEGVAVIECRVTKAGALTACRPLGERPDGYGFGAAALDLAADFKLQPGQVDGVPIDGAAVRLPVQFTLEDPSAPLRLQDAAPPPPR